MRVKRLFAFYPMRLRYSAALLDLVLVAAVAGAGCGPKAGSTPSTKPDTVEWFSERAHEAGLDFVHFNGMSGKYLYPELMAPGVALFDYDNDGDLDVFVVQSGMLGKTPLSDARPQPHDPSQIGRASCRERGSMPESDTKL